MWARDGFLSVAGALDFAGGGVVHICSGMSGLAASIAVGPRAGFGVEELRPHNVRATRTHARTHTHAHMHTSHT